MAHPVVGLPDGQGSDTLLHGGMTQPQEESSRFVSRALLAWFSEPEAMQLLLGRMVGPLDNVLEVQQRWAQYGAAVAARPAYRATNPIREMKDQRLVESISARPDIQASFAGLQWRPAMVDLKQVLSFQRVINLDGLEERVAAARRNEEELLRLCLPDPLSATTLPVIMDADQRGCTVTSLNPNLRIAGIQPMPVQVSPGPNLPPLPMLAINVLVVANTSYVHVVHYQKRYFLRDGYHRATGLLRAGISVVPCLVIEARNLDELGLQPGLFTPEVIFSDRPPRLRDFWDDAVACDVAQPAMRKVIRVQSSEFMVPR